MPSHRPLDPKDLYRLRLISDAQISPDGRRVAFVLRQMSEEKNDYIGNIYVADSDGTVVQFTSGDKDSAPRWSPDGRSLAFLSGRKERAQIYVLRTDGGEARRLTDRKLGAGVPLWSPDSRSIAFTGVVSTEPDEETDGDEKDGAQKAPAKTKITDRTGYKSDGVG
jgi:dipeptidyl aminopeptidase/acylaminoacyl peptidase